MSGRKALSENTFCADSAKASHDRKSSGRNTAGERLLKENQPAAGRRGSSTTMGSDSDTPSENSPLKDRQAAEESASPSMSDEPSSSSASEQEPSSEELPRRRAAATRAAAGRRAAAEAPAQRPQRTSAALATSRLRDQIRDERMFDDASDDDMDVAVEPTRGKKRSASEDDQAPSRKVARKDWAHAPSSKSPTASQDQQYELQDNDMDTDRVAEGDEKAGSDSDDAPKVISRRPAAARKPPPSASPAPHSDDDELTSPSSEHDDGDDEDYMGAGRPTRAAPARTTRGAAARPAPRRQRKGSSNSDDDEDAADGDDSDDDWVGGGRRRRAAKKKPKKAKAERRSARRGAGARRSYKEASSDDEDLMEESELESEVESEEDEDEELARRRTRGRAAKNKGRARRHSGSSGENGQEEDEGAEEDDIEGPESAGGDEGPTSGGSREASAGAEGRPKVKLTEEQKELGLQKRMEEFPIEKLLWYNEKTDMLQVKHKGLSYRKAKTTWLPLKDVEAERAQLVRNFLARDEHIDIDEDWVTVERIIARRPAVAWHQPRSKRGKIGDGRIARYGKKVEASRWEYLVKWRGLEYSDCTWEDEDDLEDEQELIDQFLAWDHPAPPPKVRLSELRCYETFTMPEFKNDRKLRDYQETSVRWMISNYISKRSCILGDEMGLGKTAQSISVLECLRRVGNIPGPFLLVAPLTTLGHWQREIRTWTDMNCVLYAGSAEDKEMIRHYEIFCSGDDGVTKSRTLRLNALLVSYETLLKDRSFLNEIVRDVSGGWAVVVFDEAHKLKGVNAATRRAGQELKCTWKLLLTGTPIQNNLSELWSMMNALDPEKHESLDEFLDQYGGANGQQPTVDQVQALRDLLAPVLLRRMKEDVENLPEKEEVVVWVELTQLQHQFYKAIYGREVATLLMGAAQKNIGGLRNIAMELRKICCHPFLCDGLREEYEARNTQVMSEKELLVRSCGKMVLLNKLLPKLRAENRKVLIFSQFTMMLDKLEDYLDLCGYPVHRIDGSTKQRDRQGFIDKFTNGGPDEAFVFLLSTRAGGQGITLTAADTAILYDSDWNPQNDLQAMARCHRIGQEKEVTIYRLVTKNTYEEHLFNTASRKYGLDEAILGGGVDGGDPEENAAHLASLLAHGAHGLLGKDAETAIDNTANAFQGEDIEQILTGRTEKRTLGGRAGNTFSTAKFSAVDEEGAAALVAAVEEGAMKVPDKDMWEELLPDAVKAHKERVELRKRGPILDGPRQRKEVDYRLNRAYQDLDTPAGKKGKRGRKGSADTEPEASEPVDEEDEEEQAGPERKRGRGSGQGKKARGWIKKEIKELEECLLRFGDNRWDYVQDKSKALGHYSLEDLQAVGGAMAQAMLAAPGIVEKGIANLQERRVQEERRLMELRKAAESKGPDAVALVDAQLTSLRTQKRFAAKDREACADDLANFIRGLKVPEAALTALTNTDVLKRWCKAADSHKKILQHNKAIYELVQQAEDDEENWAQEAEAKQPKSKEGGQRPEGNTTEEGPLTASAALQMAVAGVMSVANIPAKCVHWVTKDMKGREAGMPAWWNRACDEQLVRGAVKHGLHPPKACVDHMLRDDYLGFIGRVVMDPMYTPEAGAVYTTQCESTVRPGVMENVVKMVRTNHTAAAKTWLPRPLDHPPPTPRQVSKWCETPHAGPSIESIIDISIQWHRGDAPPGVKSVPLASFPGVFMSTELLVKFRGYGPDLFSWYSEPDLKRCPGYQTAFYEAQDRLKAELARDIQLLDRQVKEGQPLPPYKVGPPRPVDLGVIVDRAQDTRIQKMSITQWEQFKDVLCGRLQLVVRVTTGEEPATPVVPAPKPAPPRVSPLPLVSAAKPTALTLLSPKNTPAGSAAAASGVPTAASNQVVRVPPAISITPSKSGGAPVITVISPSKLVLKSQAPSQPTQPPTQAAAAKAEVKQASSQAASQPAPGSTGAAAGTSTGAKSAKGSGGSNGAVKTEGGSGGAKAGTEGKGSKSKGGSKKAAPGSAGTEGAGSKGGKTDGPVNPKMSQKQHQSTIEKYMMSKKGPQKTPADTPASGGTPATTQPGSTSKPDAAAAATGTAEEGAGGSPGAAAKAKGKKGKQGAGKEAAPAKGTKVTRSRARSASAGAGSPAPGAEGKGKGKAEDNEEKGDAMQVDETKEASEDVSVMVIDD